MTVYVLIREDQNRHGYVDVSITGIFREKRIAEKLEEVERKLAIERASELKSSTRRAIGKCRGRLSTT